MSSFYNNDYILVFDNYEKDNLDIFEDDSFNSHVSDDGHNDFDDEDEEERKIKEIHKKDDRYLEIFKEYLKQTGLKKNTIKEHLRNVKFYLEYYLTYYSPVTMQEGVSEWNIDDYFNDFYIKKYLGSNVRDLRKQTASIKKFYKCMAEKGYIAEEDYIELAGFIKKELPKWKEKITQYNDHNDDQWF